MSGQYQSNMIANSSSQNNLSLANVVASDRIGIAGIPDNARNVRLLNLTS